MADRISSVRAVYGQIGSISHGTMRPDDLIPCFIDELDRLKDDLSLSLGVGATFDETESVKQQVARLNDLLASIERNQKADDYFESDDAQFDLESLFDALNEFAPPYCYFGASEGDGSDYGFWISHDSLSDAEHDELLLRVGDLSEVSDDYNGEVLIVNDHGNCTFGTISEGKFSEIWSCV